MQIRQGAEPLAHDGAATSVVLCHDLGGTPGGVAQIAQALIADGLTVRVPRLSGHGTTARDLARTRWSDWYAELDAACAEVTTRGGRLVVAGAGAGAALAALVACTRDDVLGLVAIDPLAAPVPLSRIHRAARAMEGLTRARRPFGASGSGGGLPVLTRARQWELATRVTRDLSDVTAPVLLIRSVALGPAYAEAAEIFASRVSSTDLTVREISGGAQTRPDEVARHLLAFARKVTS
ncbi:alpha/beta fold hydrolase [Calidifontibacter sp. DB0510]|uniref:Alpha/beta fold hydrolase n=1 Tax=Metallococcus carri TaxID=1656884 RepID=A0A967EH55_9MICO|nr:alpha/beta fold hydrolase [Metallococcus carri]NHN55938.1 alpha/beta fold hydrolase [Metallococcus carri]NOP37605.1 alpha/beta fold hydrolase [Calidifontibacter sp. DB2511S]